MLHSAALALVLAVAPVAPPPQEPDDPAPIRGVVVDETGGPLAGVRYWVSGFERKVGDAWELTFFTGETKTSWTDAQGRFELPGRADLRFDLDFDAHGRTPARLTQVEAGAALTVEMTAGRELSGRVVQLIGPSQKGVGSARVAVTQPNPRGLWFETTRTSDADGYFSFDGLVDPRGEEWVLSCAGARLDLEIAPDEDVDDLLVEIRIRRVPR